MLIPIIVLAIVFILIAFRQIGSSRLEIMQLVWFGTPITVARKLEIWHIMLFGAVAVLLTEQITPVAAVMSINTDVMLFLFGMFVVGHTMEESGYLSHLSYKLFRKARTLDHLLLFILFGIGTASAFLMNDTMAIIGTPVVLMLARSHSTPAKPLLFALAFAITIGSVMSPIGNPQNLLIASSGMKNPFAEFFGHLFLPTMINLFLAYIVLKFFFKNNFHDNELNHEKGVIKDKALANISKLSLIIVIALVAARIAAAFFDVQFSLTYIALIAAIPVIVLSGKRLEIIRGIDWKTLVFFAAMFVLMQSVWNSGFFQSIISNMALDVTSIIIILLISVLLSQVISNVPLVALYLPMLISAGASSKELVVLAAGSTIAGNMLILGAASNVIIIQNAEKSGETISFWEFAKVGIPLTIINISVYWFFLTVF
ncbi:anion transporter [archaeon]|nr:anion transporter [archaeon]